MLRTVALLAAALLVAVVAIAWATGIFDGRDKPADAPTRTAGPQAPSRPLSGPVPAGRQLATFGNGCFWCTEAVFQQVKGVDSVVSGYSGGSVKNPTYHEVCSGTTGHAEVIQITYDPAVVTFAKLLEVFWKTHDPTTLNRQGNDVGTQYRSVVFYHDEEQRGLAESYKKKLDAAGIFARPIVTEITPFGEFFAAEGYHQNFYNEHPRHPYCQVMIGPKLEKLKQIFQNGEPAPAGN
jgi:peptide-methionine (S)-S-oxide reductase